jgi:hypothetical protein
MAWSFGMAKNEWLQVLPINHCEFVPQKKCPNNNSKKISYPGVTQGGETPENVNFIAVEKSANLKINCIKI